MINLRLLERKTASVSDILTDIQLSEISPNPDQPRAIFDEKELAGLAASIKQNGLLNPICVRRNADGKYEIIAGERRYRAAQLINMQKIPCIVKEINEEESAVLAILENIQREDLSFIEEAYAYAKLIRRYNLTQEECAKRIGISQPTVANKLRLLRLTEDDIKMIVEYGMNERQARALLRLPQEKRREAILKISANELNSLRTEQLVEEMLREKVVQPKRTFAYKQSMLYINTLNHTIDAMKKAGINCVSTKKETDGFLEYTVRIKMNGNDVPRGT